MVCPCRVFCVGSIRLAETTIALSSVSGQILMLICVNCCRVRAITEDRIEYLGTDRTLKRIDFNECCQSWLENLSNQGIDPSNITNPVHLRCVVERNVLAKPPYIEFFTQPRTRIVFRFSLIRCRHPLRAYRLMAHTIQRLGRTTADLT